MDKNTGKWITFLDRIINRVKIIYVDIKIYIKYFFIKLKEEKVVFTLIPKEKEK